MGCKAFGAPKQSVNGCEAGLREHDSGLGNYNTLDNSWLAVAPTHTHTHIDASKFGDAFIIHEHVSSAGSYNPRLLTERGRAPHAWGGGAAPY